MSEPIEGGLPPPPGVKPNFVNPPSEQPLIISIQVLCLVFSTGFVAARVYTKARILRSLGWDDYACIFAWAIFVVYVATTMATLPYGLGIHQWNVPAEHVSRFLYLGNVPEVLYSPAIFFTKLSILLQYRKLFVPTRKGPVNIAIHLLIWFNALFYTADALVEIFGCTPRRKLWNPTIAGHCLNRAQLFPASAAISIFSDFAIFVLPSVVVWNLQTPIKRKLGVFAVFAVGLLACITSIFRLVYSLRDVHNNDLTWSNIQEGLWTYAEITFGLITGCLPAMPQFFRHFVPKISSTLRSHGKTLGTANSKSANPIIPKPPTARSKPWERHDPYDPHLLLKSNYVELDEQDLPLQGVQTTIKGGSQTVWDETSRGGERSMTPSEALESRV